MKKKTSLVESRAALPKPGRRRFLTGSASAAIGGSVLLGGNMLAAINNGARAAGKPVPVGGGVPLTG